MTAILTKSDREILDRLHSNPVIQDAERAAKSEKLADRKKLLNEYVEVRELSSNSELRKTERDMRAEYEIALEIFKEIDKKYIAAHDASMNSGQQIERRLRNLEKELMENSDASIEKAIKDWEVEMERVAGIESFGWSEPTGQFDKFTGDKICEERSNLAALRTLVNQVQKVIVDLKKMRFKYFKDVEVEITKIVSDLPAIGSTNTNYGR